MNLLKITISLFAVVCTNAFSFSDLFPIIHPTETCNILSFSGAGSFGAVEVGILNQLTKNNKNTQFDMITGISAGGLNAGFLSYYNDGTNFANGVDNLKNIYINMTNDDVYQKNIFSMPSTWGYYDTSVLRQTLRDQLEKLDTDITYPTLVGSANLNKGVLDIFRFDKLSKPEQLQILMATSAIPFLFPPEKITTDDITHVYVDGGSIANEILTGVMSYIKCDKYNITFITATEKIEENNNIDSLSTYIKRQLELISSIVTQ